MAKEGKISSKSKRGNNTKGQEVTDERRIAVVKQKSIMKARKKKNIKRSALIKKYLNTQDFGESGVSKTFQTRELRFLKHVKVAVGRKRNIRDMKRKLDLTSQNISALKRKIRKFNKPDPLEQCGEHDGSGVTSDKVLQAVHALLQLLEKAQPNKNTSKPLFEEEEAILLQITSMKSPRTPSRQIRIILPHSLLPDSPDVCLFTSDLRKGRREDHEPTVQHFKNLLNKKGVTRISEIISMRQLRTEYEQYEMKRALCNRFDMFLSEAKVCGHITHLLGKTFYDRKKLPVPIKLNEENLKEQIERALHKTAFHVHRLGQVFVLKIAHSLLTPEQICENIMAAAVSLTECFPGGWDNVKSLLIKGAKTIPVPIYVSTIAPRNVSRPDVTRRPKAYKTVVGDLPGVGIVDVHVGGLVEIQENEQMDELEMELHAEDTKRRGKNIKNMNSRDEAQMELHQLQTHEAKGSESSDEGDENEDDDGKTGLNNLETAYLKDWAHTKSVEKKNSQGKAKKIRK